MNDRDDFAVWTEKYRPKRINDIVGHGAVLNKIKQTVAHGNITNMILKGPPGNGKTSCAWCIALHIFGVGNLKGNFREINASDQENRGIDVVTKKIKPFARHLPLTVNTPYRILLLDEADSLSPDMMKSLRRTMEKYNRNCRFILTVNDIDAVLPAIRSRCTEYDFKGISGDILVSHLKYISMIEGLNFSKNQFEHIADKAAGDLRKGIGILQNMQTNQDDLSAVFNR